MEDVNIFKINGDADDDYTLLCNCLLSYFWKNPSELLKADRQFFY